MASPTKQQKRAQRAKAKAKQNRSGKSKVAVVHPLFTLPLINKPFDYATFDMSTFNFKDVVENGFDLEFFDELFEAMYDAEDISLLAMCIVFLQYPVLAKVLAEEDEELATDFMVGLFIAYRAIYHNEDEDTAVEWFESETFIERYTEASRLLQDRDERANSGGRTY